MKIILNLFLNFFIITNFFANVSDEKTINFKDEMKKFIYRIKNSPEGGSGFIIPQNGVELLTENGLNFGFLDNNYIQTIDGQAIEELYFGTKWVDNPTGKEYTEYILFFLNKFKKKTDKLILVIDYSVIVNNIKKSYENCRKYNFIPYYPSGKKLNNISNINIMNNFNKDSIINDIKNIKNFLYIINPEKFKNKSQFLQKLSKTDYDLIVIDLFFNDEILTSEDLSGIVKKSGNGKKIILSYLSIGEAENYRYYWNNDWIKNKPSWLYKENPEWKGNYKVKYWIPEWQYIICGWDGSTYSGWNKSYLKKIKDAGFDGVYLDLVDAYEFFEYNKN